jgi:hypothetical protein
MVMKTPRGMPVRILPPRKRGRFPGLEYHWRKTPMMENTDAVRYLHQSRKAWDWGGEEERRSTIRDKHAQLPPPTFREIARRETAEEETEEATAAETKLPDYGDDE